MPETSPAHRAGLGDCRSSQPTPGGAMRAETVIPIRTTSNAQRSLSAEDAWAITGPPATGGDHAFAVLAEKAHELGATEVAGVRLIIVAPGNWCAYGTAEIHR